VRVERVEERGHDGRIAAKDAGSIAAAVLRRERDGSCSRKRKAQAGKDAEVSVKLDARKATGAERRERVLVLQAAELALDGGAAIVELGN
jgi:hypothetical protein